MYLLELGYSQSLLGVLNCISALSEIPVLLLIHRLSRRFKETALLTAAVGCMALRLILLSAGNVPLMAAAQLLQGPSYMVCYFVCVTYINRMVMPGKISQGQSTLAVVQMGAGSLSGQPAGRCSGQCVWNKRRIFDYSLFAAGRDGCGRDNGRMEKIVR